MTGNPPKRIVVLVGAGASRAAAEDGRASIPPPLNADFFELCRKHEDAFGLRGFEEAAEYVQHRYGWDLRRGKPPGMEEVFSYLYMDARATENPSLARRAYAHLVRICAKAVSETKKDLYPTEGDNALGDLVAKYLDKEGRSPVFITFNYDLLIEHALENRRLLTRYGGATPGGVRWNIRNAYGLDFRDQYVPENETRFAELDPQSTLVLKLHGSLNWGFAAEGGYLEPSHALPNGAAPLHCRLDRLPPFRRGHLPQSRSGEELHFLLVPPVTDKTPYLDALRPAWERAGLELAEADEIIVYGYSFPATDLPARKLLRESLARNRRLPSVVVINPDSSPLLRLVELHTPLQIVVCRSVGQFLDLDPGAQA